MVDKTLPRSTVNAFIGIFVILIAIAVIFSLWTTFLDNFEHTPRRIRQGMFLFMIMVMSSEYALCAASITRQWTVWVSVFVNCWGVLDAVLRYPKTPDAESAFAVKQVTLLVFKSMTYLVGVVSLSRNWIYLIFVLLVNTWSLPVLYVMALPMKNVGWIISDDDDVDITVRLWNVIACPANRRACIASCRGWWYHRLTVVSDSSTFGRAAVCFASAEHRRVYRRVGRSI